MEDSACDGGRGQDSNEGESETLWVWIKPAAFYNVIEARFQQNRYLLRRCLSYRRQTPPHPVKRRNSGTLSVEFLDLTRSSPPSRKKGASVRLSVIVALCESLSDREFRPLDAKCVHLRGHDSISIQFDIEDHSMTLLMLVRGRNDDFFGSEGMSPCCRQPSRSVTSASDTQPTSHKRREIRYVFPKPQSSSDLLELTRKLCFGCVPVGEFVWWHAHRIHSSTSKVCLSHWKNGYLTWGEKNIWDGYQQRQTKMLSIERPVQPCSMASHPPPLFSFRAAVKRPIDGEIRAVDSKEVSLTSTEGEIAFRFVYGATQPQCVEQRTQTFRCPFCSIKCKDLLGLRYHLAASHDLFFYEIKSRTPTVIWVRRRMEVFDEKGEIFCPITKQLVSSLEKAFYMNRAAFLRAKPVPKRRRTTTMTEVTEVPKSGQLSPLLEEVEIKKGTKKRTVSSSGHANTKVPSRASSSRQQSRSQSHQALSSRAQSHHLSQRTWRFYHSRTALPMTEIELREGIDTDDDYSPEDWEVKTHRQLSTVPDASKNQIEFMFLWDQFMHDHVWTYADYKVPMICQLFAWKQREALQDPQFQKHFLKHLHSLFMYKLIQQEDMDICLSIVRDPEKGERLRVQGIEQKLGRTKIMEKKRKTEMARAKYR